GDAASPISPQGAQCCILVTIYRRSPAGGELAASPRSPPSPPPTSRLCRHGPPRVPVEATASGLDPQPGFGYAGIVSLFDAIHDGRPERLAQLVLVHALRTEPGLCTYVGIRPGAEVETEKYSDDMPAQGWRADLVTTTAPDPPKGWELKVRARFTPAQRE